MPQPGAVRVMRHAALTTFRMVQLSQIDQAKIHDDDRDFRVKRTQLLPATRSTVFIGAPSGNSRGSAGCLPIITSYRQFASNYLPGHRQLPPRAWLPLSTKAVKSPLFR